MVSVSSAIYIVKDVSKLNACQQEEHSIGAAVGMLDIKPRPLYCTRVSLHDHVWNMICISAIINDAMTWYSNDFK